MPRMSLAPVSSVHDPLPQVTMASRFMPRYDPVQEINLPPLESSFDPWTDIPGLSIVHLRHSSYPMSIGSSTQYPDGFMNSPPTPLSPAFQSPGLHFGSNLLDYTNELQTRPSKYEIQPDFYPSQAQSLPLRTAAFKKSVSFVGIIKTC